MQNQFSDIGNQSATPQNQQYTNYNSKPNVPPPVYNMEPPPPYSNQPPPPAPGFIHVAQPSVTVTVQPNSTIPNQENITSTTIIHIPLTHNPVQITCPNCLATTFTETKPIPGLLTYLLSGALFLVGCWICCLVPCCMPDCLDIEHRCSNCKQLIGTYRRL